MDGANSLEAKRFRGGRAGTAQPPRRHNSAHEALHDITRRLRCRSVASTNRDSARLTESAKLVESTTRSRTELRIMPTDVPLNPAKPRRIRKPFPFAKESAEIEHEINERGRILANQIRNQYLAASNIYRIKHGRAWKSMHSSEPEELSHSKLHSSELTVDLRRIIDHDTATLVEFTTKLANELHRSFLQTMLELLDDTTRKTGNVVSGKELKVSLEEMLSGIVFGVDRHGVPTMPQFLAPPALQAKITAAFHSDDCERPSRIAGIVETKQAEALAEEAKRISRYRIE